MSYDSLSVTHSATLVAYSTILEPTFFVEASFDPLWVVVMKAEIVALENNNTWSIVNIPPIKHPIGCKWVFNVKYLASGAIARYKVRLVAKDFSKNVVVDCSETFFPMEKIVTVSSVLVVAVAKNWPIFQMDVHNVFLHGELVEDIYMVIPHGFRRQGKSGKV